MKRVVVLPALVMVGVLFSGCAGLSETEQRTLTGATLGAASGAVFGAIAGDAGLGAGIGAGVGLVGGFLYDQYLKSVRHAYRQGVKAGSRGRRSRP